MHPHLKVLFPAAAFAAVTSAAAMPGLEVLAALACFPILLSSSRDSQRLVLATGGVAVVGFTGAFALAVVRGSVAASSVGAWLTVLLALVVASTLALWLQQRRREALVGLDAAQSASEMNRLLMSLLAHDLRAPLTLAEQGFQYVEDSASAGYPIDLVLVGDVRARLQRSLRAIEMVLSITSTRSASEKGSDVTEVLLHEEIGAELDSFRYEAEARGKHLIGKLDAVRQWYRVDALVLRQAIAIAVDNAIRYADPGSIHVVATVQHSTLEVRVADSGPGISAHQHDASHSGGSGLGLRLCGTLLARAGGSLGTERDAPDGTTLVIRLPAEPVAPARDDVPAPSRPPALLAAV